MDRRFLRGAVMAVAISLGASAAHASSITVAFPTSASTVVGSVGFISPTEIGYFWSMSRGDSISQVYAATGVFSATSLSMDLNVTQNVLNSGASVDWDVLVNGIDVGDWTWSQADGTGLTNVSLLFPAIPGEFSSLELRLKNEVPGGQGSIAMGLDTESTIESDAAPVPEPGSLLLLGTGLAGAVIARRRRKTQS